MYAILLFTAIYLLQGSCFPIRRGSTLLSCKLWKCHCLCIGFQPVAQTCFVHEGDNISRHMSSLLEGQYMCDITWCIRLRKHACCYNDQSVYSLDCREFLSMKSFYQVCFNPHNILRHISMNVLPISEILAHLSRVRSDGILSFMTWNIIMDWDARSLSPICLWQNLFLTFFLKTHTYTHLHTEAHSHTLILLSLRGHSLT